MKLVKVFEDLFNLDAIEWIEQVSNETTGKITLTVHFKSGRTCKKDNLDGKIAADYKNQFEVIF